MNLEKDPKSKFLILFVLIAILCSTYLIYEKYLIKRDFNIEAKIPCVPEYESCFTEECDIGDPRCISNDGKFNFKIVNKKAYENATLLECEFKNLCEVVHCNQENVSVYSTSNVCI